LPPGEERFLTRLFVSHAHQQNTAAAALRIWLSQNGFHDVFIDIDAQRGLVPGDLWQEALKSAADRCEAVLCLISPAWMASKWCLAEFIAAKLMGKRIFGLIVEHVSFEELPIEMKAEWHLCELSGFNLDESECRSFEVEVFGTLYRVLFRLSGLNLLLRGLVRAGLGASSFPWPPRHDPNRLPYRGLKALEAQDAAVFFGRDAWIVRGLDRLRALAESDTIKFLVILGASGSGKSSFLRSGLWPRLLRDDTTFLPLPIVRPQNAIISGDSGLAVALSSGFEGLGEPLPLESIIDILREKPDGFSVLLESLFNSRSTPTKFI
jgi:hypothetical protein